MHAGEKAELQRAVSAAKQAEQDALSSAGRLETELADLASAYNNLEVQSYQLEAQIKRLQHQAQQQGANSSSAGSLICNGVMLSRHCIVIVDLGTMLLRLHTSCRCQKFGPWHCVCCLVSQ